MFALPSVSAMTASLSISASGWPPCPASTGTSYTVATQVTGTSSSSSTYLWIGIWDYVNGKWVAYTDPYIGPYGTNVNAYKSFTIKTPNDSGDISYVAVVYYWNWDTNSWVFANYVNSGDKISGTPVPDVQNFVISPSPVDYQKEVTLSWDVKGDSNALYIISQAYHWEYKNSQWQWVYIGIGGGGYQYVTSADGASYTKSFSLKHTPTHTGTNYYYVAAWYYDWCSSSWKGWNYEMNSIVVCRGPDGDWNYCHSSGSCKCSAHKGDCDSNSECVSGTECVSDVGSYYDWDGGVDVCDYSGSVKPAECNCECNGGGLWSCKNWDYRFGNYDYAANRIGGQGNCETNTGCVNCNNYFFKQIPEGVDGTKILIENGYSKVDDDRGGEYGRPLSNCYRYAGYFDDRTDPITKIEYTNILHTEGPECDPAAVMDFPSWCNLMAPQCYINHQGLNNPYGSTGHGSSGNC